MRHAFMIGLVAIVSLPADQAVALSCMAPEVGVSFEMADGSSDVFAVLHGTFQYDPNALSDAGDLMNPVTIEMMSRFSGDILGPTGFTPTQDADIQITLSCAGPWCAQLPANADSVEMLAFVQLTETGPHLTIDPCYGWAFFDPTQNDIDTAERCMSGDCSKER